jgi:RND family efflux transporter MFP subunit
MLKQEGDRVRKGELLAQQEETNARLALGQAYAALEVAGATLDRIRVAEEHARAEKERAENLLRSGGITDKDYQAAQVAARDSRAQVKLAEAQVEQARQAWAIAQKRLNDCRIVSPINGEVEGKYVNEGSHVDGMTLLYRLVDNQRLELETYVASSEMARLAKGQKIRYRVAAFPEEEFTASILTISPGVQLQNRSVMVRAAVPNPTGKLKAGVFVKGGIVTGIKPAALVVPPGAVWRRVGQPSFIFVAKGNRAQRREVKTGLEQPQAIEITEGLKAGEQVVAEPNLELADGVGLSPRP